MGLRFFAGGSVYDSAGNHGVCVREVYKSVHVVINAINSCESFDIVFPESEEEQQKLVDGFLMKCRAGFKKCVLVPLMESLSGLTSLPNLTWRVYISDLLGSIVDTSQNMASTCRLCVA